MTLNTDILIVEDNPADAELFIRSLEKKKLANNIHVVKDGAEALDFVFCKGEYSERNMEQLPKIIFLDLKLPKINGLDVLKKIKENKKTKNIPVIVVTSSGEEPDIKQSYSRGANSYVVKPVEFDEFIETVQYVGEYWMHVNEDIR